MNDALNDSVGYPMCAMSVDLPLIIVASGGGMVDRQAPRERRVRGAAGAAPPRTERTRTGRGKRIVLLAAHLLDLREDLLREVGADVRAVLVDHGLQLRADLRDLGRRQFAVLHR